MAIKPIQNVNPEFVERYQLELARDPRSRVFAALSEAYRKMGLLDEAKTHLPIRNRSASGFRRRSRGVRKSIAGFEGSRRSAPSSRTRNPPLA